MGIVVVWEPNRIRGILPRLRLSIRRALKPRIFGAIAGLSDESVLALATPRRLRRAKDEWGASPLVACIGARRSGLACQLIDRGGNSAGDGALAHAAMQGDLQVVVKLLESGANPDETLPGDGQHDGFTPLIWATNRHHFDVMRRLLEAGANINAVAKDGTTASICTRVGTDQDLVALRILCPYLPDLTVRDWRGRCLIDEARDRERCGGQSEMRQILEQHFPDLVLREP